MMQIAKLKRGKWEGNVHVISGREMERLYNEGGEGGGVIFKW